MRLKVWSTFEKVKERTMMVKVVVVVILRADGFCDADLCFPCVAAVRRFVLLGSGSPVDAKVVPDSHAARL